MQRFPALWSVAATVVLSAAFSASVPLAVADEELAMQIAQETFGKLPDGTPIDRFTLSSPNGLAVRVMTYGATMTDVFVPDRDGRIENVTLHLDSLADYLNGHPLFGSVVGRFANRIAGATFRIRGVDYPLTPNAGQNHIHGGRLGFQKVTWRATPFQLPNQVGVELSYTSPDWDEGYPGELNVRVVYSVTRDNCLLIEYWADTNKTTHVNLTNHAYWNLAGAGSGDVFSHELMIDADSYLPSDEAKVPTGEIRSVADTPMDFRKLHAVGLMIDDVVDRNYDHCYVLNKQSGNGPVLAARVVDRTSGRTMDVLTTQPGLQLYTAKHLSSRYKAGGKEYGPYYGLCLETQAFPDAPNKSNFPSTLLRPVDLYHHVTVHRFGILH